MRDLLSHQAPLPMVLIIWNPSPAPTNQPTFPTSALYKRPPGNSNLIPSPTSFSKFPFTVNESIFIQSQTLVIIPDNFYLLALPYIISSQFQSILSSQSLYATRHQM